MRIAFAGKGGAGKTSLAGTLARTLARRGYEVLALDHDPNPNLALALGLPPESAFNLSPLPAGLVKRAGEGYSFTKPVADIIAEHGHDAPDGVRLLVGSLPEAAGKG